MPDKSPRIPSIFRDGVHVSPAAWEDPEKETVS